MNKLHEAAKSGDIKKVQELIDSGEDVDARDSIGTTPLHRAAMEGHAEVSDLLLKAGADMNARTLGDEETPLFLAASERRTAMVKLLLERGADVNSRTIGGYTAMWVAAAAGCTAVVDLLRQYGGVQDVVKG